MSTRTRIILRFSDGTTLFGAAAVHSLIKNALPNGFMVPPLPYSWKAMLKRDKLQWLAGRLKYGLRLELYQEIRGARKKYSMYWQARGQKEALKKAKAVQAVPIVVAQNPPGDNVFQAFDQVAPPPLNRRRVEYLDYDIEAEDF